MRFIVFALLLWPFLAKAQLPSAILPMACHDDSARFWLKCKDATDFARLDVPKLVEVLYQKHIPAARRPASLPRQPLKLMLVDSLEGIAQIVVPQQAPAMDVRDFSFYAGSCVFQFPPPFTGKRNRRNQIFKPMAADTVPEFMLWLGDNVYYMSSEWNDWRKMVFRHLEIRQRTPIAEFYQKVPSYAIWDDHDYGPNNAGANFHLCDTAKLVFNYMWMNPYCAASSEHGGIFFKFRVSDVEFFMLDSRFFNNDACLLCPAQMAWLKESLRQSTASFKFICVGVQMLVFDKAEKNQNFSFFEHERKELFDFLHTNRIEGVVFLTGDRHFGELNRQPREAAYPLYEITTSPLTSFINRGYPRDNPVRQPNTLITSQNYARISLQGTAEARVCVVELRDRKGELWWRREIPLSELRYQK